VRRSAADAGEQRVGGHAQLAQRGGKQRVVLEAIAAATPIKELLLEIAERKGDPASGLDREVLEQERL
jgi:hypothetical protein